MAKHGKNGVTTNTPKNIIFGAGTIHKNLKYSSTWNLDESIVGATKGGSKFEIVPEIHKVEPDGATVAIKGFNVKIGEKATMEINMLEITEDLVKSATLTAAGSSKDNTYNVLESKEDIVAGDYWENIAFVGETLDHKNVIVIMENALCTSGFSFDGKNKEEGVPALTFECHADPATGVNTLPYHIYFPKAIV